MLLASKWVICGSPQHLNNILALWFEVCTGCGCLCVVCAVCVVHLSLYLFQEIQCIMHIYSCLLSCICSFVFNFSCTSLTAIYCIIGHIDISFIGICIYCLIFYILPTGLMLFRCVVHKKYFPLDMLCARHCKVCSIFTRNVELYTQTLSPRTYSCASGQTISTGWLRKRSNGRN